MRRLLVLSLVTAPLAAAAQRVPTPAPPVMPKGWDAYVAHAMQQTHSGTQKRGDRIDSPVPSRC